MGKPKHGTAAATQWESSDWTTTHTGRGTAMTDAAENHGWAMSMDADGIIFAKLCKCGFMYEGESELIQHAFAAGRRDGAVEALEQAAEHINESCEVHGQMLTLRRWLRARAAELTPGSGTPTPYATINCCEHCPLPDAP
jgi:hypothetical protein